MICLSCKEKVSEDYFFCPWCGNDLDFKKSDDGFVKLFESILNLVNEDVIDLFNEDNLKIFVNGKKVDLVNNRNKSLKQSKKIKNKKISKVKNILVNKNVVVPLISVIKDSEGMSLEISLPGVKGEEDLQITDLNKSVEIIANSKNKTYFTTVKKPKDLEIVDDYFEKGVLLIRLE